MALSTDQFRDHLTASGLLSAEDVSALLLALPEDKRPKDGEQLARELVKQKKLTKYQAEQIYAGKGKGLVLGNYTILDKLGQGGMGMVLKAEHKRLKRLVAIKVMSPSAVKTPDALKRFHREVEAAAKLRHPNVVATDDADEAKGTHFLVMEYVEGSDLSALVKRKGPLPVAQAVQCIVQAARGLEFAHQQGVVHRDIKPANLLMDAKGTVKILDMGLARIEGATSGQAELTSTGAVMGTVDYMAPEQAMSTKSADARSDVYSLGISLWYLLAGKCAYDGDTLMAKLLAHRDSPIPSLCAIRSDVPASVDAVFQKMVAKQAKDRYQTMTEVIHDLEACQSGASSASASSVSATSVLPESNTLSFRTASDAAAESITATYQAEPTVTYAQPDVAAEATLLTGNMSEATDPHSLASVSTPGGRKKRRSSKSDASSSWWQDRRIQIGGGVATVLLLVAIVFAVMKKDDAQTAAAVPDTVPANQEPVKGTPTDTSLAKVEPQPSASESALSKEPTPPSVLPLPTSPKDLPSGFIPLFNGKDLTGWKGEVGDPKKRAEMAPADLAAAQAKADERMRAHWSVDNGVLTFDGRGDNLCTVKDYTDFELYLEWNITAGGDSGIYLRGTPQVQIWDSDSKPSGKNMGSGGLYNNRKNPARPLLKVDKPIGEWNAMFIRMVGEKVTVSLNGKLVVDDVTFENFLEPDKPIYPSGPIELQKYGSPLQFRNVLIRELKSSTTASGIGSPASPRIPAVAPSDAFALQLEPDGRIDIPVKLISNSAVTYEFEVTKKPLITDNLHYQFAILIRGNTFKQHKNMLVWADSTPDTTVIMTPLPGSERYIAAVTANETTYRVFLNGQQVSERNLPAPHPSNGDQGFYIGRSPGAPAAFQAYDAPLHRFRLSRGARYSANYDPSGEWLPDDQTLVLYDFRRGGTADQVRDLSGNNKHGKLVDAKWVEMSGSTTAAPSPAKAPFDSKQARAHQEAWAKHLGTAVETTNSVGGKMVIIPPGEFLMGTTPEQANAIVAECAKNNMSEDRARGQLAVEASQHPVQLTRPFLIGATEVTYAQFRKFADATGYRSGEEQLLARDPAARQQRNEGQSKTWRECGEAFGPNTPVVALSYMQAGKFCNWLSEQEGLQPAFTMTPNGDSYDPTADGYRLPTEAEWEFACRAGTDTWYSFGNDLKQVGSWAVFSGSSKKRQPSDVATKQANSFGLYDMHGNAQEWCCDYFDTTWYGRAPKADPFHDQRGAEGVLRGGGWTDNRIELRSAIRRSYPRHTSSYYTGFRLARTSKPTRLP